MAITTTKVGPKYQVTIPRAVREALRLEAGDLLEVRVAGREVMLKPKILVDRDPELEEALTEAEADIKAGRVYGPYDGATQAIKGLHRAIKEERRRAAISESARGAGRRGRRAKK
jgi:AbrB family looped-hinge helix DNA binding protein